MLLDQLLVQRKVHREVAQAETSDHPHLLGPRLQRTDTDRDSDRHGCNISCNGISISISISISTWDPIHAHSIHAQSPRLIAVYSGFSSAGILIGTTMRSSPNIRLPVYTLVMSEMTRSRTAGPSNWSVMWVRTRVPTLACCANSARSMWLMHDPPKSALYLVPAT